MRARVCLSLCLCLAGLACAQAQEPAQPIDVLHIRAQLVLVDASVVNRRTGQVVPGLTADDFDLREDGVPQTVTSISSTLR